MEKLAKQAVFAEANANDSSHSATVSDHLKRLFELMKAVNDKDGIRQLQAMVKKGYRDEVARAMEPAATAKDFELRLNAAEKVSDEYRREDDIMFIIEQELTLNPVDDAAHAASKLPSLGRFRALDRISVAYLKQGDIGQSRNFLDQAIADAFTPDKFAGYSLSMDWLEEIANEHLDIGDLNAARIVLEKLLDFGAKTPRYEDLIKQTAVHIYSRLGEYDQARRLLESLGSEDYIRSQHEAIRYEEAVAADPSQGLLLASKLHDPDNRAHAFLKIAEKQSITGDSAAASNALNQALEAAQQPIQFSGATMAQVATAWAELGNITLAEQILEQARQKDKQEDDGNRYRNDEEVAVALARLGDFDQALEVAQDQQWESPYAYGNIAFEQTNAGQVQQVLKWATSLKSQEAKAEVLLSVCDAISPGD